MSQTMKTLNGYEIVDNYARTQITAEKAALKQEIATERKRIDALASLPEGSTAGDAELVDAHIDYTGKNWESTGAHIRGVTSQLSEQIRDTNEWLGKTNNLFNGNGFISTDNSNWNLVAETNSVIITHKTKWEGTIPHYPLTLEVGTYLFNANFNESAISGFRLTKNGTFYKTLKNDTSFDIESDSTYEIDVPLRNVENETYVVTDISIVDTSVSGKINEIEKSIKGVSKRTNTIETMFSNDKNTTTMPAIISFIDDDCRSEVYRDLFPLICSLNIPYTIACPINSIGKEEFMTFEQLNEMVEHGVSISCHGFDEVNMDRVTSDELNDILKQCEEKYEEYGLDVKTYAYCQGVYTDESIQKVVKKHFKAGFLTKWGVNKIPFESYYLKRYGLLSDDSFDLEDAKAMVDDVAQNGGWLIFMTHAWFDYFQENAQNDLPELVNYIRSKNIDIKDINKVLNDYGNDLDCGVFKKSDIGISNFLVVDYQGNVWTNKVNLFNPNAQNEAENMETNSGVIVCGLITNQSLDSDGNTLALPNGNYNFYSTKPIDVTNCNNVLISGWAYYGRAIYAFYDESGNCIGKENADNTAYGTTLSKKSVSIPNGAKTLIVSGHENYKKPYVKKIYN